ncbi:MAG: hypothetical protein QM640_14160 [Niabella sp.]
MQSAKLHLSFQQIKLVTNAEWILTKNEILRHIKTALEEMYTTQQSLIAQTSLPSEIVRSGGKISRGENYLGLPWMVLDYPRCFVKENIFAIRSLFWWGRLFSTTLHLSGKWQQQFAAPLLKASSRLRAGNFLISSNGNEWLHDAASEHYTEINNLQEPEFEKILQQAAFVKIAAFTGIEHINDAPEILMRQFELLVKIVS